jgi:hypothetical protein
MSWWVAALLVVGHTSLRASPALVPPLTAPTASPSAAGACVVATGLGQACSNNGDCTVDDTECGDRRENNAVGICVVDS